jgi:tRNA (guanine37-N1)-methyltransferase
VLTLFPEMFPGPLGQSLAGKGLRDGRWAIDTLDIRSFATDKHRTVDDTPFGGGAGMVMRPDVVDAACAAALASEGGAGAPDRPLLVMTPRGRVLDQAMVRELAAGPGIVLLCGRYEGIDERVREHLADEAISIGPYVVSGGELPAMVVVDAIARLLPGALGSEESGRVESFSAALGGGLEYPHYTRPADFRGSRVPDILLSGDHGRVDAWRRDQSRARTRGAAQ